MKDSVSELIEAIKATNRLQIIYEQDLGELEVSNEIHIAVYRILQEHFTNILKHAKATLAHVQIHRRGEDLEVIVTDNGQGFDSSRYRKGIGMENMMSRAESVHGKLQLNSAPGKGCQLDLRIPFSVAP